MLLWKQLAEELETFLGDPKQVSGFFSFAKIIESDEQEKFPEELCCAIHEWGLSHYYIPPQHGGRFKSFEEILALIKVVARRDLTTAIAHSATYLGSIAVWMEGSETQKSALAELLRGGHSVSFCLTERAHGSDLLSNEVMAKADGADFLLSGEKWLINNASRSTVMVVFARTPADSKSRGFSLFMIERSGLDPAQFVTLPKLKTLGIRGADLGGVVFRECRIGASSRLGVQGGALEVTLKALQVTRTLCSALSLGAANAALQLVLAFSKSRVLYGKSILSIPSVQRTLTEAYIDVLVCDCVAIVATRGLHFSTSQFSVWSAVVKYFVPSTTEAVVARLGTVIGARGYLREGPEGLFQKIVRDNAIVGLFDGNTAVNLHGIAAQLAFLLPEDWPRGALSQGDKTRLSALFDVGQPVPEFDFKNLSLFNHGQDDVLSGLPECLVHLQGLAVSEVSGGVHHTLAALTGSVIVALRDIGRQARSLTLERKSTRRNSSTLYGLAKDFCNAHAAAVCIQFWVHNRKRLAAEFQQGEWLILAVHRLLGLDGFQGLPSAVLEKMVEQLVHCHEEKRFISLIPVKCA